jgi:pathogenesis-related protein 1
MNAARLTICLISLLTIGQAFAAGKPDVVRSSPELSPVSNEIVAAHNSVRSKVGVPPLAWSDELAQVAQNWANRLMASGAFEHSRTASYGENLLEVSGTGFSSRPSKVVSAWAAESASYQYQTNSCFGVCGHYTQIVWRETKSVGCGVAHGDKREIWVCNYAPYGNVIGEKPY